MVTSRIQAEFGFCVVLLLIALCYVALQLVIIDLCCFPLGCLGCVLFVFFFLCFSRLAPGGKHRVFFLAGRKKKAC